MHGLCSIGIVLRQQREHGEDLKLDADKFALEYWSQRQLVRTRQSKVSSLAADVKDVAHDVGKSPRHAVSSSCFYSEDQ